MTLREDLKALEAALDSEKAASLVRPLYRAASPRAGLCYAASRAALYLIERHAVSGWSPRQATGSWGSHWWLEKADGTCLDLTSIQFEPALLERIYAQGKRAGWVPTRSGSTLSAAARSLLEMAGLFREDKRVTDDTLSSESYEYLGGAASTAQVLQEVKRVEEPKE